MKTRKSITKRFKITRTGKVIRRAIGQDHLRAKKTGNYRRAKRKLVEVTGPLAKQIKKMVR